MEGFVQSHPFKQGNKRTAFLAAIEFLYDNGYAWVPDDNGEAAQVVISLVTHEIGIQEVAAFIRENVRPAEGQ